MAITDKSHLITPVMDKKNINELPQKVNPTKKLGYFGRIVPIKGVHFLVKSFCKLLSEHPDIDYELHIYGPFAKESYFHEVLELIESNWKSRIFLYNEVFNSEKRQDILKDLDLLVYTTAMDGLPYVFLEAMSLGTPVISTNVGGISHLINDGVNGRLMNFNGLYVEDLKESAPYNKLLDIMKLREEEYYEEFKRVLLPLLLDFDKIKEMSLNSIKIVGCDYDISMMNRHFKRIIYNNLLC
jgi:glycosyltransferase involved in cell wall biosynthesis